MTRKTKEAIKATAAIVIVVVAVFVLWIYPLNQAGKIVSRPENEPAPLDLKATELKSDSLSFVTEDNIRLWGAMFAAQDQPGDSGTAKGTVRGTVILVHGLFEGASSQMVKAAALTAQGFAVVVYDQRDFGRSGGRYCSGGYFEANDLQAVVARLELENRLIHPVIVWGEDHGAAAAVLIWERENRIDYVVAENPVVNGRDWQKRIIRQRDLSSPDIMLGILWWWMKQKSGYEIDIDQTDISDQFGTALVNKPGRLLAIACGDGDTAANPYVEELHSFGTAEWLLYPCPPDQPLFDSHQEDIIAAIEKLLRP